MRMIYLIVWLIAGLLAESLYSTEYHVNMRAPDGADKNPGTLEKPWKTLKSVADRELKPGDKVIIHGGVYRESLKLINLKGTEELPIIIEGARDEGPVILKGAVAYQGKWEPYGKADNKPEPYPNAFMRRWVTEYKGVPVAQIVLSDFTYLQQIGQDSGQKDPNFLPPVGFDVTDMFRHTFFHDIATGKLYMDVYGTPGWYTVDINTGATLISLTDCSFVTVRDLETRYGGAGIDAFQCSNLLIENVTVEGASNNGIGLRLCKNSKIVNCSANHCGCTGMGLAACWDCEVINCEIKRNNYRNFHQGWHAGGTKNVKCVRCSFIGCTVAYNNGDGIWFDIDNQDIKFIGNKIYNNEGAGIFYEISVGNTLVANNIVFRNKFSGVYISGSAGVNVVNNTIVENGAGIVVAGEGRGYEVPKPPLLDVTDGGKLLKPWGCTDKNYALMHNRIYNNLLICNGLRRGDGKVAQLVVVNKSDKDVPVGDNLSDYNVFAASSWWTPYLGRNYNDHLSLDEWRKDTGNDMNSRIIPVPKYRISDDGLFEWEDPDALANIIDICPRQQGVLKDFSGRSRNATTDAGAQELGTSFWSFLGL